MTLSKKVINLIIEDFTNFMFTLSQDNIIEMGISDRGDLLASGETRQEGNDRILAYTTPYSAAVNNGSVGHPINEEGVNQIRAWVSRKLGIPDKDLEKVTNAIVWNIRKNGTDPKPFLDNAVETAKVNYKGKLDVRGL